MYTALVCVFYPHCPWFNLLQVAYAHPIREQPLYYASHATMPSGSSGGIPGTSSFGVHNAPVPQPSGTIGYPYFYGSQQGGAPQSYGNCEASSRVGHAKVKRAQNSDCMLHDPAETLVVRYFLMTHLKTIFFVNISQLPK